MSPRYQKIFIAIFILSLCLRLGLALVNLEANDDHMEVVRMILNSRQLPGLGDCRECFHPKLFYASAAGLLQIFGIHNHSAQIRFIQFVNFLVGALVLALVWKFIQEFPSKNEPAKLTAFAVFALNPKLIAINSQASNDSFVILFCTAALFFAYRFLKDLDRSYLWLMILVLLLAISTKITAWVTFAAIISAFVLRAWTEQDNRNTVLLYLSMMIIFVPMITIVNPLSQFVSNYQKYGFPVTNTTSPLPLPTFSQPTTTDREYNFRPGIVSIQDGFLTFKLIDLLQYPLITNGQFGYPPQRTSFWTMLYADIHSLHFQNWPPSWQVPGTKGFNLSRGVFILGLLPAGMCILGFLLEIATCLRGLFERNKLLAVDGLFLAGSCGYVLFLMLCALLFREFSFIKFIYILPGLLAFIWLFLRGAEATLQWLSRARWVSLLANLAIAALLGLYVLDVITLGIHLYTINLS